MDTKPVTMEEIKARLADHIVNARRKETRFHKRNQMRWFDIKLHGAFKVAIQKQAEKERRSMTNYILWCVAKEMNWKGEI
jgi:hypothetical protein